MKDNFSHNSSNYAHFRPSYPKEVFTFLETVLSGNERVWDCATGTGQVASELVHLFDHIEATDLSENQLKNAVSHPKINYSQQVAEQTNFPDAYFDCVTVGQAIHWFDFEKFYAEVKRVLKPNGILVVLGYGNIQIENEKVQKQVTKLYSEILGAYWDAERKYIDEAYETIPFPLEEIATPHFQMTYEWTKEQLLGYLGTWSAVRHYREETANNPLVSFEKELPSFDTIEIIFPTLLRAGRINKEP